MNTLRPAARRLLQVPVQESSCICTCRIPINATTMMQKRSRSSLQMPEASTSLSASSSAATVANAVTPASIRLANNPAVPSGTSRASSYRPSTELPKIKDQRLFYFGVAGVAVTAWSLFVMWAMSAERASSSVMRTITFNLRSSSLAKEALGEGIRPTPFLSGEPWVYGKVNVFQGIVDINFRVEATDGRKGMVYFKSERPHKAGRFETKAFKLVVDGSKQPIDLLRADTLS